MGITDAFAEYLQNKQDDIKNKQIDKAKECKLDYMSVVTAGAQKSKSKWGVLLQHIPRGNAPVYGLDITTDSKTAALINGFNAHCLELDDGQRFAMIHLGASVISALNAAAADYEITEENYLTGIIMGYEAACRVAIAMQPSHKKKGYHTAGTCGTIGAAAGIAFALGMDGVQLKRVLTAACASAAGMLEIQEQASEMKPYNLGRAAMDGLSAAYMGYTGFLTPEDIIGGERGFFSLFSEVWEAEKLIERQDYFEIDRIYVKPYASCRHSHSAVEAAIRLHDNLDTDLIESVEVRTYFLGVKGHDHSTIQGTSSAKLSTPYAVAAGLLCGRADLTVFEPVDERIVELAQKIKVFEDVDLTKESPAKRVAIVTVRLKDGTEKSVRVDYAKGDPENPLSSEELKQKAESLLQYRQQN